MVIDPQDGKLPYLPEAAKRAKVNWDERDRDPVGYCHPHGVPPSNLCRPSRWRLSQDGDYFAILSETEHTVRGDPGKWQPPSQELLGLDGGFARTLGGDALVVDVTGLNGEDVVETRAGNFVDKNEHVVERFTMKGPDTIVYEATVTDPTVYSRPWTIRIPLARQTKITGSLIEYDCVEEERDGCAIIRTCKGRGQNRCVSELPFCFLTVAW